MALLRDFPGGAGALGQVVDGWEMLLAERLDPAAIAQFAQGRAEGWLALGSGGAEVGQAARQWALADLALNLPEGAERDEVCGVMLAESWHRARLPRTVRPLAVLHALAGRALRRQAAELLDGPGAMFTAMRVGLLG